MRSQNIAPVSVEDRLAPELSRRSLAEAAGPVLAALLGALLVVATALGPLVTDHIRFHMSSDALVQYVGGEIVTAVVALVLLLSAAAWRFGREWPPAVAGGAAAYVAYTFATVVGGQEYGRYGGNAEEAFLLYTAITAVSVLLLVTSFERLVRLGTMRGPARPTSRVLIGVGTVMAILWIVQVIGFYRTGPTPEYETTTALFWLIKYLDLGLVIPLAVVVGLLQRAPSRTATSAAAAVTMLGLLTWLLAAVLLMGLEMLRRDTPGASWVLAGGVLALLGPTAACWIRWLISSSRRLDTTRHATERAGTAGERRHPGRVRP